MCVCTQREKIWKLPSACFIDAGIPLLTMRFPLTCLISLPSPRSYAEPTAVGMHENTSLNHGGHDLVLPEYACLHWQMWRNCDVSFFQCGISCPGGLFRGKREKKEHVYYPFFSFLYFFYSILTVRRSRIAEKWRSERYKFGSIKHEALTWLPLAREFGNLSWIVFQRLFPSRGMSFAMSAKRNVILGIQKYNYN